MTGLFQAFKHAFLELTEVNQKQAAPVKQVIKNQKKEKKSFYWKSHNKN